MADGTIIIDTQLNNTGLTAGVAGLNSKLGSLASKGMGLVTQATKVMAAGMVAATGAVVALTKASVEQYAEYEQLTGGVETLFKESADVVERYAAGAYKTAGLSANEYMSTITGFSASLLQGLGGDTKKAAQIGNMAVTDMSDNANKMGTSMESIQNAYQGFAKQNYTMLDNLKLGYGGTKGEMQRLLADAEKLSGVKYDISNFSDVISAIHVIQDNLGITGTTAKEAMETISGSLSMTKAAWKNLLTAMSDDNADVFEESINNLVYSVSAFGKNIMPRIEIALNGIGELISQLLPVILEKVPALMETILPKLVTAGGKILSSLGQGILQALPVVISAGMEVLQSLINGISSNLQQIMNVVMQVISTLVSGFLTMLPQLLAIGIQILASLIQGIAQQLPTLIPMAIQCVMELINTLIANLPLILNAGMQLLEGLANGIINAIPVLVEMLPQVIQNIVNFISANLPLILEKGCEILLSLINGLVEAIPQLIDMLPTIIDTIVTFLTENLPQIIEAGIQVLIALINGIINAIPKLIEMLPRIITTVVNTISQNLPKIISAGIQILGALINGLIQAIPSLANATPQIIDAIWNAITNTDWLTLGKNIIAGIGNGIVNGVTGLVDTAIEACNSLTDSIKNFFGIHSPSHLMRDEVGKMLMKGVGVGVELETPKLSDQIDGNLSDLYSQLKATVDVETAKTTTRIVANTDYQVLRDNKVIDNASNSNNEGMLIHNVTNIDGRTVAETTAPYINTIMGNNQIRRERGGC